MSTQSAVTSIEDTETHIKTPALLGSKCTCRQRSTDSNVNPWKEERREEVRIHEAELMVGKKPNNPTYNNNNKNQ